MRINFILSIVIFLISLLLIGQNLDKPFWGEHDWNGVRYGNIARNYLRYSFYETKLGQVENSGIISKNDFEFYTHYPPLLPMLIAFSYKLLGISEISTRMVPLLFTAGSIVMFFLIGSHFWGLKGGITSASLALVTPIVLYFGKNPVHDPLVVFLVLLSFWGYLKYKNSKKGIYVTVFLAGLVLAEMMAWAGYFWISALTLVSLLKRNFREVRFLVPFWIITLIIFVLHFVHVYILTGFFGGGTLLESFLQRTGISKAVQPEGYTLLSYLSQIRIWMFTLFTAIITLLSLIWLVSRIKLSSLEDEYILSLGVLGGLYAIIFSNALFIHNYLIIYFLPFVVLSSTSLLINLFNSLSLRVASLLILVVIFLVSIEKRSFVQALDKSDGDKFAVEIGQEINGRTSINDKILITPKNFSYSADNFLKFYSDRNLTYSETDNFNVKVIVDQTNRKFEIIYSK